MDNEELLTHIDRRFTTIDHRFTTLEGRFSALEEKMDKRFDQVEVRLDKVEEDVHQTRVVAEATHSDIMLLAETAMHVNERVNEAREQPLEQIRDMNTLHELRYKMVVNEVKDQFRQIGRLSKRVSAIEKKAK